MNLPLGDLVHHASTVQAELSLGAVFHEFSRHAYEFMAVLEGNRFLGLCARADIGMLLGSQYGFSLFAQRPIRDYLRPEPVCVDAGSDIELAFELVFTREATNFYDDVVLLDPDGEFLGLISTQTLVKLQNRFHRESIRLLEQQRLEIALKNQQMEADLRLSRELQQALLPGGYPVFPPGADAIHSRLRFHHAHQTYGLVGGDFFHVQRLSDLSAGIFLADVMGHGIRSALVTAMLRALLEELGPLSASPAELLTELNRELVKILGQEGVQDVVYATALYMVAHAGEHRVSFATAGHPCPIHIRRRSGRADLLRHPEAGTLLGLFDNLKFHSAEWRVEPEDSILLFTDGIYEVENPSGEDFGLQRMLAAIESAQTPTAELLDRIVTEALAFSASQRFTDDVCLLAVDFNTATPLECA